MPRKTKVPANSSNLTQLIESSQDVAKQKYALASVKAANFSYAVYKKWVDVLEKPEGFTMFPLNADVICAFLFDMRTNWEYSLSTVENVFSKGIRRYEYLNYSRNSFTEDEFNRKIYGCLAGLRKKYPDETKEGKTPLLSHTVYQMVESWSNNSPIDQRDKCLLLIGNILGARMDSLAHL